MNMEAKTQLNILGQKQINFNYFVTYYKYYFKKNTKRDCVFLSLNKVL